MTTTAADTPSLRRSAPLLPVGFSAVGRSMRSAARSVYARAWGPVDGASLAAFRMAFGVVALVAVVRFFAYGWIDQLYLQPAHHFTYYGFSWVKPWPAAGMYAHFAALGLLAVAITAGYRYRLAMALFFVGFTYIELIDKTTYLNHYYWVSLASFIGIFLPLNNTWSVDQMLGRVDGPGSVSALSVWAVRAQVGIVYLFAGLAKVNPDWLLHAQPLRIWLSAHTDFPLFGPLMDEAWMAYAFSWGGAAFDLTIVGWLLWRRSRPFAYVVVVGFHIATWLLFPIGIFPWLMMSGALIFFAPGWPRRFVDAAKQRLSGEHGAGRRFNIATSSPSQAPFRLRTVALVAVALFLGAQVGVSLRHFTYPGNVRWTEEGYRFSWRVLLTEKTGFVNYRVVEPNTGRQWLVSPDEYLSPVQVERSAFRPDMVLATAHWIAEDFESRGVVGAEVYADAFVTMNGKQSQRFIDPEVDLASLQDSLGSKNWILRGEEASPAG